MNRSEMTYEQRAGLAILGRLAIEGALDPEFLNSPSCNSIEKLATATGDALIDALHILGCPHDLTLAQILDGASTYSYTHETPEDETATTPSAEAQARERLIQRDVEMINALLKTTQTAIDLMLKAATDDTTRPLSASCHVALEQFDAYAADLR